MVAKVLGKTGVLTKTQEIMYKALFQAVLLYVIKIWVVADAMMMVIEEFHHRVARLIAGMKPKKSDSGEWERSSVESTLETT